jgi:hypothetical protein
VESATTATIANVDLEGLERAIYLRAHAERIPENDVALKALCMALQSISAGAGFGGYPGATTALWTRLAAAITALFVDPGFRLSQEGFDQLAAHRSTMEAVFKASIFGGSDHLFALVQEEEGVNKYLLLFPTDSKLDLDLAEIFTRNPQEMVGLYLSMLGYAQIFTPEADARRNLLISLAPAFEDVDLPLCLINALCAAYMHVSYSDCEGKHEPKRVLHAMMARLMQKHVKVLQFPVREEIARPTILIVFDWWWSRHAMYRCYSQSILQLKRDFRLIGLARNVVTDEPSRAMFDQWIGIAEDKFILADVAQEIANAAPDIIYYPSIGMSSLTISLASLRLAPLQVMSYGHPATTNSPEIDYGIIENDMGVQACFSEKLQRIPSNTVRYVPFAPVTARHRVRVNPETIKIAVCAMQVKVGWPFIRAMQQVQKRARRRVEFHFFCAAHGVGLFSMANQLKGLLENTMIYERADYQELMEWVAGCDICLFSFPFGGTNSVIDAMLLGIPFITLEGLEPHARTDAMLIRRAGLPQSMIALTQAEYVTEVTRLVDEDDRRHRHARLIRRVNVARTFFEPDHTEAFVNAFSTIYRRHTKQEAAA